MRLGRKKAAKLKVNERRKETTEKVLAEIQKLKEAEKSAKKEELDTTFNGVVNLTREFFGDFFGVKYQFTYQELEKELEKKHIDADLKKCIKNYMEFLRAKEYSPTKIKTGELQRLISELELMVIALKNEGISKETGFGINVEDIISGIGKKLNRSLNVSIEGIKKLGSVRIRREPEEKEELAERISKGYSEIDILSKISEAYRALDSGDLKRANRIAAELDKAISKSENLKEFGREVLNLKETIKLHEPESVEKEAEREIKVGEKAPKVEEKTSREIPVTPDEISELKRAVKIPISKRSRLSAEEIPSRTLLRPATREEILKKIQTKKEKTVHKEPGELMEWPVQEVKDAFKELSKRIGEIQLGVSGTKERKEKNGQSGKKEVGTDILPVVEFIKKALHYSINMNVIRNRLLELGWPRDKVREAFSYIEKGTG